MWFLKDKKVSRLRKKKKKVTFEAEQIVCAVAWKDNLLKDGDVQHG